MRKLASLSLISMVGMVFFAGCGAAFLGTQSFVSNEAAVLALGNTTWGDADGNVSFTFDANGKLTGFSAADLPPELANLRLDGESFTITIPSEGLPPELSVFAGRNLSAAFTNTSTTIDNGTLTMVFVGSVDIPLVDHITFTMNADLSGTGSNASLSNISGSLTATVPFVGDIPVYSGTFANGVDAVKQ